MNDEFVRRDFQREIGNNFASVNERACLDIEYEWILYRETILKIAVKGLGTSACGGTSKTTSCCNRS